MIHKVLILFKTMHNFFWECFSSSFDFYLDSLAIPSLIVIGLFGLVVYYEILMSYVLVLLCRYDLTAIPFFIVKFVVSGVMCFSVVASVYGFFELLFAIESGDLVSYFLCPFEPEPLEPKPLQVLEFKIEGIDDGIRDLNGKEALKKEVKDSDLLSWGSFVGGILMIGFMVAVACDI